MCYGTKWRLSSTATASYNLVCKVKIDIFNNLRYYRGSAYKIVKDRFVKKKTKQSQKKKNYGQEGINFSYLTVLRRAQEARTY